MMQMTRTTHDAPIYPDIKVVFGGDENSADLIARVERAMRRRGFASAAVMAFRSEAARGDFDHVVRVCMRFVAVHWRSPKKET